MTEPRGRQAPGGDPIAFVLNGAACVLGADVSPTLSLLDWLRGPAALRGTKEGCAEGDCGACTVGLERPDGTRLPLNACLVQLGQIHGAAIRTVEGMGAEDGTPSAFQRVLAANGGTQCGFCTPGIVASAWAHAREGGDAHEALAGNLCRCTGYRPIVDAFATLDAAPVVAPAPIGRAVQPPSPATFRTPSQVFHRPVALADLVALRAVEPEAWLLAGGTDLGLRVSEGRERPPAVICTLGVAELREIALSPAGVRVGAAVSYRDLLAVCDREPGYAPLAVLLRRLGSRQIRALGTLGGNLGSASPIGDALPPLLAYGATVRLAGPDGARELAVDDFLTGYRTNALAPGEVIRDVWIARPGPTDRVACEKLSRRYDQDITAVGLSLRLTVEGGTIRAARVAHGGLGPRAARAPAAEAALEGSVFGQAAFARGAQALETEVAPLSDLRASAAYRRLAAGNLLRRLGLRWTSETPA